MAIEVFEERWHGWITTDVSYTFTVEPQSHIFLRRAGVTACLGFDELLKTSHECARPMHIWTNIKAERDGLRAKLKARSRQAYVQQDSSDVEIIEDLPMLPRAQKRQRSESPVTPLPSQDLPISPWSLSPTLLLSQASPSPSPSLSSIYVSLPASQPAITMPPVVPVVVPKYPCRGRAWPWGMYTVDMVQGFKQLSDKRLSRAHSLPTLFQLVFGVPFVKPTYYDNLKAWTKSHHGLLEESERAGRCQAGLWSSYLAARRQALGERSKVKVRRVD